VKQLGDRLPQRSFILSTYELIDLKVVQTAEHISLELQVWIMRV
jgi:hypothetical protein